MDKKDIYIDELEKTCNQLNNLLTKLYECDTMDESTIKQWFCILDSWRWNIKDYYSEDIEQERENDPT